MYADQPIERRSLTRAKVFLGGNVANDSMLAFPCIVRDLTADGARVEYAANTYVPDHFQFRIPAKGCVLRARVIWRRNNEAGLYFEGFEIGSIDEVQHASTPTRRPKLPH